MGGQAGSPEHRQHLANQHRNRLIPYPVRLRDENGDVFYSNEDAFKPQPFFIRQYKKACSCPHCGGDIRLNDTEFRKTIALECSHCKEHIDEKALDKIRAKLKKIENQAKKKKEKK